MCRSSGCMVPPHHFRISSGRRSGIVVVCCVRVVAWAGSAFGCASWGFFWLCACWLCSIQHHSWHRGTFEFPVCFILQFGPSLFWIRRVPRLRSRVLFWACSRVRLVLWFVAWLPLLFPFGASCFLSAGPWWQGDGKAVAARSRRSEDMGIVLFRDG